MSQKKYTIYGNCQGQALAKMLNSSRSFSSQYEYVPIEPVHKLSSQSLNQFISNLTNIDLLIYQPVSEKYKGNSRYSSQFIVQALKPESLHISFPSVYFRGYHPELRHLKDENNQNVEMPLENILIPYHDTNFIQAFLEKNASADLKQKILNVNFYRSEFINQSFEQTLQDLQKREEMFAVDIRISEFIKQKFQKQKLFYTVNHPANIVLNFIVESIFNFCQVQDCDNFPLPDLLGLVKFPIYSSVYQTLDLEFDNLPVYKIANQFLELEDMILQYFKFYETLPIAILKKNVEDWNFK